MEASPTRPIIIKKKRKKHGDHHGGSWKVAYADFVTAMMAFFLLMWLLSMASPEKKIAVSEYFKSFDSFDVFKTETSSSGKSFMTGQMTGTNQAVIRKTKVDRSPSSKPATVQAKGISLSAGDLMNRLKSAVDEKLHSVRNQVLVDVTGEGVRIQIVDTEGSPMFSTGSAAPTPRAREILQLVTENIIDTPNRIAIEGHTDAAPFRGARNTNWELSTDRASSARRTLEASGIDPERIARVVGYADQEPYNPLDPKDPRNRRISIILLQPPASPY